LLPSGVPIPSSIQTLPLGVASMTMIRFKLIAACMVLVTGLGLGLPVILADLMPPIIIKSPKDLRANDDPLWGLNKPDRRLPNDHNESLKITSKRLENGLIQFVVRIDAEAVEHVAKGDIYEGRVTAVAHLELSSNGKQLASIQPNAVVEKKETVFTFSIAESLAETSKLTLNTHLHEKNGRPTFGGGQTFVVSLHGFLPGRPEVEKKIKIQE